MHEERKVALERLEPLVGRWRVEAHFPQLDTSGVEARTTFEWALGGQYLLQRAEVDIPEAPDVLAVIDVDASGSGYTQHYFDSRGVTRVYAMAFDGETWTLSRGTPDFSPLAFSQRFTGRLSDDGSVIEGRWDIDNGNGMQRDFDLTYTRVA